MGSVVFSLDAELAWGFHDESVVPTERVRRARSAWLDLIELFDEYEIPATWAVVGHLFLAGCDGQHEEVKSTSGWFERDPGGQADQNEQWFAPTLVEAIADADTEHEIGIHTFSHVEFGDRSTTKEIARTEIKKSLQLADEWGIDIESIVFPRNNVGHRDVLAEYGISCYRGREPTTWYDGTPLYPPIKFAATLGSHTPKLVCPSVDEYGLVNIPASMYLFTFDRPLGPLSDAVVGDVIVRRARRGIDAVANSDGIFHAWLHPNNLTSEMYVNRLRSIIEYASVQQRRKGLEIRTMADIAGEYTE